MVKNPSLSKETTIETVIDVYAVAEDAPKLMEAFKLMLAHARTPNKADSVRLRMAHALTKQGEYEEAIECLKAITEKEGITGRRLIPELEKKLREKQQKEEGK